MFLSIVPFLYSKRTAAARSLVSLIEKRTFCGRVNRTVRSQHPLVELYPGVRCGIGPSFFANVVSF